jgi:glycosyltransferase involved in cell wall biosynthesis
MLPDAHFTGWVDKQQLASLYSGLELFVFPSRFDTFGNVILEANVYGMPAISYNCKGPKDIIRHGVSGYLAEDIDGMAEHIVEFFSTDTDRERMKRYAMARSEDFQAEPIMDQFMHDLGLVDKHTEQDDMTIIEPIEQRSVA